MFNIRQHQFLVLLFVVETKHDNWRELFNDVRLFQYYSHGPIIMAPIVKRLTESRSRDESAFGTAVHFTRGVIVRVEQVSVLRMYRCVVRQSLLENKGLEKPAGVRQMPFRGAYLRHGLNNAILGLERLAELFAEFPHPTIRSNEVVHFFPFEPWRGRRFGSRRYFWGGRHKRESRKKNGQGKKKTSFQPSAESRIARL